MAAPSDINCKNLSGKYVINKTLSDDPDPLFALQGLSWLIRTAISYATVVITVKEYQDQESQYHIDITSVAAGVSSTQEDRTLNWTDKDHSDRVFGNVRGKSQLFKRGDFEMQGEGPEEEKMFLQGEQLRDGTSSHFLEDESVQSWARNQDEGYGWTAEQVWNFEEVEGQRHYTRRVIGRKEGQPSVKVRLVYDYKGPSDTALKEDIKEEEDGLAYGDE